MAMHAQQTAVGVFSERGLADRAVDALQTAGFRADQIFYSGSGENPHTDFWSEIGRLFSHERDAAHDDLTKELKDFGLTDDEVSRYDHEYHLGRTIVAVKSPDRRDEAVNILRVNGAHN